MALNCILVYSAFFQFSNIAVDYIHSRFGFTNVESSTYFSIVIQIAVITTPCFGLLIDKFSNKGVVIMTSCSLVLAFHVMVFTFENHTNLKPLSQVSIISSMVVLGLFNSSYGIAFWSCIPLIVPRNCIGSAYGFVNTILNTGMALFPVIFKFVIGDATPEDYVRTSMLLILISAAGTCVAGIIVSVDMKSKRELHSSQAPEVDDEVKPIIDK
jgi:nitrate/nitrite transporter NarK